ncbi:tetratricopeptide repeat protein [Maritimibacter alexandrii]|uniref:tetratricopeptide repeat protein n=1 Tax=Maritimibacter alexandrii TaxID=2570355 RepID=UPI00110825A3|nr:tetratricopeptide repeat protein [Maritimibacter alexandrii]
MKGFAVIVAATLTIPGVGYSQDTPDGSDEKTPSVQVGDTTAEMTGGVAAGGDDAPSASGANTAKDRDGEGPAAPTLGGPQVQKTDAAPDRPSGILNGVEPRRADKDGADVAASPDVDGETEAGDADVTVTGGEEAVAQSADDAETDVEAATDMTPDAAAQAEAPEQPDTEAEASVEDEAPENPATESAEEVTEAPEDAATESADEVTEAREDAATESAEEVAEEPEAAPEPDRYDIAAQECIDIAGPANAGVPAAAVDAASQKETLARAAEACLMAAEAEDADPEVLFHAASIAQARGQAGATFDLLTRSAEAGLGAAETRLGDYFLFGVGPEGQDIAKAVGHYQAATERGDAAGMTTLALLYQVARGVPRDPARMVELMTMAADKGYHFAQYRLAQTYLNGDGIPGRADAALGIPDTTRAVRYYTMAADAGNLSAALELSSLYADPNSGLPDDPEEQVRLTRMVSQTGHPPAIAMMGVFYETGRGVEYDPAIAAGLYVRAMESGKLDFGDLRNGAPGTWDRDTALEFQKILQARGLYDGALDAIVGGGTAAAARKLAGN